MLLRDIEEDPELSSQVNKYKDADVMNMLSMKMNRLDIEEKKMEESKNDTKKKVKAK